MKSRTDTALTMFMIPALLGMAIGIIGLVRILAGEDIASADSAEIIPSHSVMFSIHYDKEEWYVMMNGPCPVCGGEGIVREKGCYRCLGTGRTNISVDRSTFIRWINTNEMPNGIRRFIGPNESGSPFEPCVIGPPSEDCRHE